MIRLAPRVASVAWRPPLPLLDNHGRTITYLRLAITDRCNLRCRYCRPEQGVPFIPHHEILTYEEMERLVGIFLDLGISKVRVTGGEPFSRRGCVEFLARLRRMPGLKSLHLTTNGVKTGRYLESLADMGIDGINLSLDTLDRKRFWKITRRDYLESVLQTLYGVLKQGVPLKINSVALKDTSDAEIIRLAELTKDFPITLRFIERMPFSGGAQSMGLEKDILALRLRGLFPMMEECAVEQPTTARLFSLPGCRGKIGIIEGYSRRFCRSCNKIRITPTGLLKTCLYDDGVLDLKRLLRSGLSDLEIGREITSCVQNRFVNGLEAERYAVRTAEPSMAGIGG